MKNMSFRANILLGICGVIALFSAIIFYCIFELTQLRSDISQAQSKTQPYERLARQMAFDVVQVQQFLTDVSATHDRAGYTDAESHAQSFRSGVQTLRQHYAADADKLKALDDLEAAFAPYYANGKTMAEGYIAGGTEGGNALIAEFDRSALVITDKMAKFSDAERAAAEAEMANINVNANRAIIGSMIVGLLGVLVSLGMAWRISGSLLNQIGIDPLYAKGIAKEIAKGNLSRDITLNPGDNSSLLYAIRAMQIKLREMIREVSDNANSIVNAAHQLSDSAQSVLAGSRRQNDAASSVAAAVEEMTANIEHIAHNADASEKTARHAGEISDQGSQVVSDAVTEMNQIAESVSQSADIIRALGASSQKISEIVKVIKEIADQTNLLALNAAIEAARAGEQGRGFAVVADEVRKLAERTSRSTQEISAMISEIQAGSRNAVASMDQGTARVAEGVDKAQLAGASMSQIKQGTEQVVSTAGEITSAIREQSAAVNLVARDVEMIAAMASENTHAVDELAQTSEHLNQLADALRASVSRFNS